MAQKKAIIRTEQIERRTLLIRGQRVVLDSDLADLYGVSTKRLNEQVKRNKKRFPADFMFQITKSERSEVVPNCDHLQRLKFSPVCPHAFTEHGAIMAATVLNTERAIEVSVYVVRVFVKLRELLVNHRTLAAKLNELEHRIGNHDHQIKSLLNAIHRLMEPPPAASKRKKIGYLTEFEST